MAEVKIRTNKAWREFKSRDDVPKKILKSEFDWTDEDYEKNGDYSDGFIHYLGCWYHLSQFMKMDATPGWHGGHADSFFSGVLIKLSSDGEVYQIATYTS